MTGYALQRDHDSAYEIYKDFETTATTFVDFV